MNIITKTEMVLRFRMQQNYGRSKSYKHDKHIWVFCYERMYYTRMIPKLPRN